MTEDLVTPGLSFPGCDPEVSHKKAQEQNRGIQRVRCETAQWLPWAAETGSPVNPCHGPCARPCLHLMLGYPDG